VKAGNHDPRDPDDDDREERQCERASYRPRACLTLRSCLVGAGDDLFDGVEPGRDPVADLALAEARRDGLAEDLAR
jgi:hypothetical protein